MEQRFAISAIGVQVAAMVLFVYAMTISSEKNEDGDCVNRPQSAMIGLGLFLNLLTLVIFLMIFGSEQIKK